jgi:hypothetical protein
MKRVVKRLLIIIASTLYVWMIFLSVGLLEARFTIATPSTIKTWLQNSGTYGSLVDEQSKLATIQQIQANSLVQISQDEINQVARDTFPASSIQTDAEGVIDGFYGWFKGDTNGPEFKVDFSSRQAGFAKVMANKVEAKINALPVCTTTGRFSVQAFDPFKADCKPKGANIASEITAFETDLETSKDILPQQVYLGSDIKVDSGNGQKESIATVWSWVANVYKAVLYGPWLVIFLTLLCALALVFLSTSRRQGLKRFSGGLMFVGVVLIVSGFFLGPAFNKLNTWSSKSLGAEASFTQHVIDPFVTQMSKTYSKYNIIIGIALVVPAIITYGALFFTRKNVVEREAVEQIEEPERSREFHNDAEPILQADETQPFEDKPELPARVVPTAQPIARAPQRPVTRRPPMIQG